MRRLMWFALPFGAGCALCCYLLPELWRAGAAGLACAAALGSLLLRGKARQRVRLAAVGCAAGILWFAGCTALYMAPAEALAGGRHIFEMELADYAVETRSGARCTVRVKGLRGDIVYYGPRTLLELEPGNHVLSQTTAYSARDLAGEESRYFVSHGIFLRLYGSGEALAVGEGNAGHWWYLPVRVSRWLREAIDGLYSEETGGLVAALLTGERDGLSPQASTDLSEAGLMHITAVSGLHCGFLIALLGVLVYRRQRLTAFLGYPVLLFYMVMAGCTPSVVRSCIMVGFVLFAPLAGREGDTPTALSAALLVILLANPYAIASVSLQLSFAAVGGLLASARWTEGVMKRRRFRKLPGLVRKPVGFCVGVLSASLGVMAATAPLSALWFGTAALVSPLSNLMVLWIAPVLFAAALIVSVIGGLCPALAGLAAVPEALAGYVLWAAGLLAKIPGHGVYFTRRAVWLWLLGSYLLAGLCLLIRGRGWKWPLALVVSAAYLLAVKAAPRRQVAEDRLTAVVVDVGQGAAVLFHSGDRTALVDCGSLNSAQSAGDAVAVTMDEYSWDKLDYVLLTHYHEDHASGLPWLLAQREAEAFLLPQLVDSEQGALQQEVLDLAARYGTAVRYVEQPCSVALGGAVLTAYPPVSEGSGNEAGLTVLCTAGEDDILITGDMNAATERKLTAQYTLPDIEVLVAGHHGSRYSTSEELLEAVTPELGIISVGQNNFGHPTPEAMERMTAAGMEIRRTDEEGNILLQIPWQAEDR